MHEVDDILLGIDQGMAGNVIAHSDDVKHDIEESALQSIMDRYHAGEYETLDLALERFSEWRDAWIGVGRVAIGPIDSA